MRLETKNQSVLKQAVRWTAMMMCGLVSTSIAQQTPANPNQPMETVSFTPTAQPGAALVETGLESGKLALAINKTAVVTTKEKYKRFSVGQPEIADVTAVGPTTLLVTGKKFGTTQIIIWDEAEQSQVIDVSVDFDIAALRDEFKRMFPDAPISVDVLNGQVTLKGRVPNLKVAEQAERVAKAYSPLVINFLEIGGGQQIVLQVQFIEMSRAASNELGFSGLFTDGRTKIGTINGGNGSPIGALAQGQDYTIDPTVSLFASGNIGGTLFEAFLSAMKSNSLARTLAEPNLVAISGEDAEFLAGGEIPIPVPQAGAGGSTTITIEYKEFGVRLKYNAVVLGDGRIRLKVNPEVSELDYNNSTSVGGQPVPGIRTRKVQSIVEMAEGQTLALAGLLQRRVDAKSTGTPGLADLPIIGAMFRSVTYSRSETELVILVTPKLAQAMNPGQVPALPGADWRYPNEAELYGFGDLGGSRTKGPDGKEIPAPAPRFVGPNGFDDGQEPKQVQPAVASTDSK